MDSFRSLVALLARRAASQPDERAYVFLSDRGEEEAALTFRELHDAAHALAARLDRDGAARRSRHPGVSARPRIPRCLLRLPDRACDRGADDDAAPTTAPGTPAPPSWRTASPCSRSPAPPSPARGSARPLPAGESFAGFRWIWRLPAPLRPRPSSRSRTTSPSCNTPPVRLPTPRGSRSATPICSPIWK